MFHTRTLLIAAALSSALLISCSNETLQDNPVKAVQEQATETLNETQSAAAKAAEIEAEKALMLKKQAELEAEQEAALRAEAKAKAEADAAKAAEAQAAQDKAEAEQKRIAQEKQADLDAQRREAQRIEEAERLEAQRIKEAQIARDAQLAQEAQARQEQARLEQARQEQARQEQARLEQTRQEQARQEQARLEQERLEQERQAQAIQQAQSVPAAPVQPVLAAAGPNAPYNEFLSKYVRPVNGINLVAYDKVTPQDRAKLRGYIETLSAMDIEALPRDAEMATWFNLYNAKTIELILENYPTKSIRKIGNPWKKDRLVVNGKNMSLDDIEHGTVRKKYDEPRVHYAFNCASIGCPNVKSSAWEASSLEADLAQASRDFVASERGVSVQGGKITVSSIFKWYKKDFGGNEAGVLAHLRQYASGSKKAALDAANDIDKYDYDWDLNIQ